jgi:hypothetical protein
MSVKGSIESIVRIAISLVDVFSKSIIVFEIDCVSEIVKRFDKSTTTYCSSFLGKSE